MENIADIKKALKRLANNQTKYEKSERYYDGDHDLSFATDKFKNAFGELFREFALNLCPAIVDAPKDKLKITGFKVENGEANVAVEAWKIWQRNRMGLRSGIIHKEALKNGDAYVIVWADRDGNVTIYPQKAAMCAVFYDDETPGKILWAAKWWQTPDKKARLNLYYPNRTEKYVSKDKIESGLPLAEALTWFTGDGEAIIANDYGIVPFFHFANNADIGATGVSELKDAIPVQNGLNKTELDKMVAMEFAAYRQRWAAGIEIEYDENGKPIPPYQAGIERLWTTDNPDTKFGSFDATELKQFLDVKESSIVDMARVTGTPLYYFIQVGGNFPSGEALKKSETRFINKVFDRMESFGAVWEDVMAFALALENKSKNVRLFTEWVDPAPLSETEKLGNIVVKKEGIGISEEQAMIEAGYGETDIRRMQSEKQVKADYAINAFNAGEETNDTKI